MKIVLLYRHTDGRLAEIRGDGSKVELWQLYPQRELLGKHKDVDTAKAELDEGYELDKSVFAPPCPSCEYPHAPMSLETGYYTCPECDTEF
ncbi:MAG: hypothetical protein KDD82_23785 [Planctomycetes bacterium]|nr:hypothetical protein [Planctomycetota bacterium]